MRLRSRRPAAAPAPAAPPDPAYARLAEALEALPIGVVVHDERGREVLSNSRGRSPTGDLHGDTLAAAAVARAVLDARSGLAASETLDLHGPPARVVQVQATPLGAGGTVAVITDLSERRHLDKMRRDFIANVNHELRTPIGALALLAEALKGETDPATVERLADRISSEAARAGTLIDDLLEFSRIEEAAPATAGSELVAVATVVDDAVERVRAMAEQHRVRIAPRVGAGGDLRVVGDRAQLASAVTNLLTNAVKYSEPGGEVAVGAEVRPPWLDIEVTDHGIGIPARDLDRIFERFYRVDRARDRRTGGTGLGLAIVRHVAVNHGGDVSVRSVEGVGSTFTLRLPLPAAA